MKHSNTNFYTKGIVLVSSMILLLISSILAISSLKGALLESRIAQRYSEHSLLFQQTESALLYAEAELLPAAHLGRADSNNDTINRHIIPFHSLSPRLGSQNLFAPSAAEISRIFLPGSKVRGRGPQNTQANLEFFRVKVSTNYRDSIGGAQIMSTVIRGAH